YHSHGRAFYHLLFTFFFSFTDTAPPAIYTLSLHDALPISQEGDLPSPKVERAQLAAVAIWCGLQFDSQCCRGWGIPRTIPTGLRSEEHTSELQSRENLVCRLLLEKKKRRDELEQPGTQTMR